MFILKGNICGDLCADCREPLYGSIIRFYRVENLETSVVAVVAPPKTTLQVLDEKAVKAKSKLLMAEAKIDEKGNYEAELDDSYHNYGGPLMVDIVTKRVPNQKSDERAPVQFTITVLQPEWRESANGLTFIWNYCLSTRFWCYIRSLFDAWVICGKIISCEDEETPIVGVKVTAFDADWLTDDELGSGTTDNQGHFRIDYTSKDFKQTFLSPIINVETPFPPYNSGPDVYFKVETVGGQIIYEEERPDGKKQGRKNIGHCFCIELCVPIVPEQDVLASAWTGVGTAFTIPVGVDLNDFDTAGYAGSLKYAITGSPRMTGQVAISSNNKALQGNPIEYRFRISDVTGVNGGADVAEANFDKTVGVTTGLFVRTKVGQMWYLGNPFKVVDVYAEQADLDAEGWLDVNKSVLRTFTDRADLNSADLTDPTEHAKWNWVDLDGMMEFNTAPLTENTKPIVAKPGDAVPVAQRKGIEKIAIRFEIREVIDKAANNFNYLPGSGQTLNAMLVNNTGALMEFDITQLAADPCGVLTGAIAAAYTVHHPHLEDVNINLKSNSGAVNSNLTGTNLPLTNNTNDALNHLSDSSLSITAAPNNVNLVKCAYIATLSVKRRLHTGDGGVSTNHVQKAFYYEV